MSVQIRFHWSSFINYIYTHWNYKFEYNRRYRFNSTTLVQNNARIIHNKLTRTFYCMSKLRSMDTKMTRNTKGVHWGYVEKYPNIVDSLLYMWYSPLYMMYKREQEFWMKTYLRNSNVCYVTQWTGSCTCVHFNCKGRKRIWLCEHFFMFYFGQTL